MSDVHSGTGGGTEPLERTVDDVSNVLLLSSEDAESREYGALLTGSASDADHLFGVVYGNPDESLDHLRSTVGEGPEETTVLAVCEDERGAATVDHGSVASTVETIPFEKSETLPIRVRERFDALASDAEVALCFDSVSHLVDDFGLNRSFRFLDTLTGRLSQTDATGHFHLDPDAHDEQTLSALTTTFDAVVRDTGDEEWELVWKRFRHGDGV